MNFKGAHSFYFIYFKHTTIQHENINTKLKNKGALALEC